MPFIRKLFVFVVEFLLNQQEFADRVDALSASPAEEPPASHGRSRAAPTAGTSPRKKDRSAVVTLRDGPIVAKHPV